MTTANKQDKSTRLSVFKEEVSEVIAFICAVETTYRANKWSDSKTSSAELTPNRNYTLAELYETANAQVNKIAQYFEGPAALWWQNMEDKPYTWDNTPEIRAQRCNEDQPRWGDIRPAVGLKYLLKRKFRSATHIADA